MKSYDEVRRARFGSTKSQFGKVGRNVDFESDKPRLAQESFVQRPKAKQNEIDSTDSNLRNEISRIKDEADKSEIDTKDFAKVEGPATVKDAPRQTSNEILAKRSAGGAFLKAWTTVDHVVVSPVIQPKKSWFYPNYIVGNIIVDAMDRCIDGNQELTWMCPNYFSLAVRLYYAVMFYVQILKAKEAAGKLSKSESTWFRSFKRIYPLESLPIAGPMVPYYSNIVSVKPNDDKYDFIYPDYRVNQGLTVEKGSPKVDPIFMIQPNVTILAEFLAMYAGLTTTQLRDVGTNASQYFDVTGSFVPHTIGSDFSFAGINFQAQLTAFMSASLANVAMDNALAESKNRCNEIHHYWKRSRIPSLPRVGDTYDHSTIGQALRMEEDFEWFEDCIHMATVQCKFMSDSTNMSQIPATGGSEVLISAEISQPNEKFAGASTWYPGIWHNLKAKFYTTRADTEPDQFANAEFAMTTGTVNIRTNQQPIGGRQAGHRDGPYWLNREFEYKSDFGVEVARRTQTMILSLFYDSKGEASQ
jgi:hypothetical protein